MHRRLPAIPTTYRGVRYRSRLEARWACLFDKFGWSYEYEPIDLHGYIPDFVLAFERPVMVECKPFVLPFADEDCARVCARIDAGGWTGDALVLGATITVTSECEVNTPRPLTAADGTIQPAEPLAESGARILIGRIRVEGDAWRDAYLARDWYCPTPDHEPCLVWFPTYVPVVLSPSDVIHARMAWADAGNTTQWRAS